MRSRVAYFLTRVIAVALVLSAASSFAASLYPFYLAGGVVSWSSGSTNVEPSPESTAIEFPLETIQGSSKDNGYRFGVGFSFNERWSVEASYVDGPTKSVALTDIREVIFGTTFSLDFESKAEVSIFRANPVFELTIFEPISVVAKVGIARVKVDTKSTSSLRPVNTGGQPLPGQSVSSSVTETKAFAGAGLKLNFLDGKIAAVASYIQYLDPLEGVDQAFELDLFWRF